MESSFYHFKFQSLESTQSFLTSYPNIHRRLLLVSTTDQMSGRGRRDKIWTHYPGTLCFSFNLPAQPDIPLSLHLANALVLFMREQNVEIKLKWPNDLFTLDGLKCGGILTERKKKMDFIGIGINLKHQKPFGFITYPQLHKGFEHDIPFQIRKFISHYTSLPFSTKEWEQNCIHHKKLIEWSDDQNSYQGINTGIDNKGGLIIDGKEGTKAFYTGSLRIL